jgi:Fe2+ or Zn2+ uptake regulation protein
MRNTIQGKIIQEIVEKNGHITNLELYKLARLQVSTLTPASVHRITKRYVLEGVFRYGPTIDGVKTIDANSEEHDHFFCSGCKKLVDIKLSKTFFKEIQKQLPNKVAKEKVLITGVCTPCEE